MRWQKRMLEDLDQDIRDHIERDAGQHRTRDVAGGSAVRGDAQVRQRNARQGADAGGVESSLDRSVT
jgi:hypothetical protein